MNGGLYPDRTWGIVSGSIIALEDGVAVLTAETCTCGMRPPSCPPSADVYGNYGDTAPVQQA